MLEHLHISNLALIEDMSLDFDAGLNILTGETGAGKSFILKALGFVTGDKLGADIVRPGADRAKVEAIFVRGDEELVLRRELMAATGRSRFYINDTLTSQEALRELRPALLSHASQHAQQQLLQPGFQADLLNRCLDAPELFTAKEEIFARLKDVAAQIEALEARQKSLFEKRELLEMQKSEIEKLNPEEGEEEHLEALRAKSRANMSIKRNYNHAMEILRGEAGLNQLLQDFERVLGAMAASEEGMVEDARTVSEFRQFLNHLAATLPKPDSHDDENLDMDKIEERLFAFAQLKRKLKRSMPEILELKKVIDENLSFLDICALDLKRMNKLRVNYENELEEIVKKIIPARRKAAAGFTSQLEVQLRDLGFSEYVKVYPEFATQEVWPGIQDERGYLMWAPNPGQKPQALDKIASGGELSRFLLAITSLGIQNPDMTFIFDEVDAGVGGLTLNRLADKLQELAVSHQVILISHWPQLAARATRHFKITKNIHDGNTFTQCHPLDHKERKQELARMAGGGKEGRDLAESLLG